MTERKTGRARIYALYADPDCLLVEIESGEWCQDGYKRQILDKLVAESGSVDSIYEHNNLYALSYSKRALKRRARSLQESGSKRPKKSTISSKNFIKSGEVRYERV